MFGRPLLGICVGFAAFGVASALAMYCPTSDYDQVEKLVTDAPSRDVSMRLPMACQLGSSGDVGPAMIIIKNARLAFWRPSATRARRSYDREAGKCGERFTGGSGTMFQSIRAIYAAQLADSYAVKAAKAKKQ